MLKLELSSFLTQAEDEKEATTDQPIVNAGKLNKSELEPEPEAEPEVEPEAEPPFSVPKSLVKVLGIRQDEFCTGYQY